MKDELPPGLRAYGPGGRLVVNYTILPEVVIVSLGSETDPEFSAHLRLPRQALAAFVHQMDQLVEKEAGDATAPDFELNPAWQVPPRE